MFANLEDVVDRFREVEGLLSDPAVISDQKRYRELAKEHADLTEVVTVYGQYQQACSDIEGNRELLRDSDPEMKELAKAELPELEELQGRLEEQLKTLLLPKDPNDDKNIILEIRNYVVPPIISENEYISAVSSFHPIVPSSTTKDAAA